MNNDIVNFYRRVRVDGHRLERLYPGWRVEAHVSLSDNISAVVFIEERSARRAAWFLNSRFDYCGSHIEFLLKLDTDDVLDTVAHAFKALYRTSLSKKPLRVASGEDISAMPEFLSLHLSLAWSARNIRNISVSTKAEITQKAAAQPELIGQWRLSAITRLLDTRITAETLIILSPYDDKPLRSQLSFMIEDLLVHRFYDDDADAAFYLIWRRSGLKDPPSLYLPDTGLVISDLEFPALIPAKILAWMLINPSHVQVIEHAQHFDPESFGLGRTSDMTNLSPTPEVLPEHKPTYQRADLISPAWAFLSQSGASKSKDQDATPEPDRAATKPTRDAPAPSGFLSRIRRKV
ncbi:hypothetical protein N5W20_08580 [Candidatus Kirkpatrickella diaphorinae]|uniref:DUF4123 domain-containing protein n=1 Tax=Candidatus Kirkpatrickella diaphorinae TaxID=2984322 RepID=A0ABY6GJZ2_9PROT|nr:hypothetical protein [Candidatus Kirkpatrickella diaphorinae]UYH51130.1 hypothetical protein N5W20_08580 [Candidatus Kirkpatrickella diaphorinae]